MSRRNTMFAVMLAATFACAAGEPARKRWEAMEYGPYLAHTYTGPGDNWCLKGNIVRLDKQHQVYACYDIDTMRVAMAWRGGFIDWKGVVFDGAHHAVSQPKGTMLLSTKPGPGWSKDGSFTDPRPTKQNKLPSDWLHYNGLYINGEKVIFSYNIGDCRILELPGTIMARDVATLTRTFQVGATAKPLSLLICEHDGDGGELKKTGIAGKRVTEIKTKERTIKVAAINAPDGAEWEQNGSRLHLKLPALSAPAMFKLFIGSLGKDDSPDGFGDALNGTIDNLEQLIKGGAPQWTETVTTQGSLGSGDGPYVVDTLTAPDNNPWNAWMRFGGLDFFPDGKTAALSTWSGDVWIVSGIDEKLEKLTWKRFATGLHQPLGLKIVDGKIYLTCRDQITRLHDLNNDGEADFYENFNNDCELTRHFHEFALDLHTDKEGNFYYAKGATPGKGGPNFDLWSLHNGCLIKVSKDGKKFDVVARGLRAPNGIGVGPNGELTSGDNQGSWVPSCPINWIKPGGFVGIPDGVPGEPKPTKRDNPLCWIPFDVDNSSGSQVWVTSDKWGPFQGHMLHLSYGKSSLFKVLYEKNGDEVQGGVAKFPLNFASGIMRARFNDADGQLYVCGLKGWQTTAIRDGCFQRVRFTGKNVHMPLDLKIQKDAVSVTFTCTLDETEAKNLENYSAEQFNIKWTAKYGSPDFSVANPDKQGRDPVEIKTVTLSADKRTVTLSIPGLQPVTNLNLDFKIKAADGAPLNTKLHLTVNSVPK